MILEDKHIDSTIVCGVYGCEDTGDKLLLNCYDNAEDLQLGLRFSKAIDYFSGKPHIGLTNNPVTFEQLAPYPLGQHRCNSEREVLYIFSNEWDMFTVQQLKPLKYNSIALINRLDDYVALSNAFDFIHEFKRVVLISTVKEEKWLYEANKRIVDENTEIMTIHMEFLDGLNSINDYFIANGEEKTKELISKMFDDLAEITVPGVVDIGTVKEEDTEKVRRYFTMLDKVDSKTGGLSGFWLVTGQTGNGKTEFCKQISLAVIEQGGKVFYYSGEEKKEKFLNSLACKVVDGKNILSSPRKLYGGRYSENDFDYYANPACMTQIKEWLKGRYYIYDEVLKGGNVTERIVKMLEAMHKEKGITVFFLDNLMTLTTGVRQSEINQVQTELADALKDFANDYNVIVVLVAHPNKSADVQIKNTDISGSLNVPNLTHVIVSVRRATKDEMDKDKAKGIDPRNSYITCTKDRPTGDLFKAGVIFDTVNKVFIDGKRPTFSWRKEDLDKYISNHEQEVFDF